MMSVSLIAILMAIILNLVPADADRFTMKLDPERPMSFVRQADGGWKAAGDPASYSVAGTRLTVEEQGKSHTHDLAAVLGLDAETDLKKVKQLRFFDESLTIERKAEGVDLVIEPREGEAGRKRVVEVRWQVGKRE